jgi:MFS transporter, PAT family, beta-lactamase induction signal transducer AmpG
MASRSKRALLWTSTTYFGEGLPWSFLHQMCAEFLTATGASVVQVSATSAFHAAVTLKFLWSPFVDLFGRKRTWLWVMQLVLGLGMFAVAAIAPHGTRRAFWIVAGVLAILSAVHDVACDGFYLQALGQEDQATFAGTRTAAFKLATIVGSSALVYLAAKTSWTLGFGAAGVLMLVTGAVNRSLMPIPAEHHPDAELHRSKASAFLAAYASFIKQPQALLVLTFLFLYRVGDIMMFNLSKPLLRELGVTTAQRGILNGFQIGVATVGAILGGLIVGRRTLARSLTPIAYLQNLSILLYVAMAACRPHLPGIVCITLFEQLVGGVGITAYSIFMMQRCRSMFSASHFAFITVIVSLASTLSGIISGFVTQRAGFPIALSIAFLCSVPSLVLVFFVPKTPIEPDPKTALETSPASGEAP